jgi:hypothetical protein
MGLAETPELLPPAFWTSNASSDPEASLRMEADVHGKNITQGFDMSGTISSSPGALSSSFKSKSESHSAQPL